MENQKEIWKDVPNYEGIYQVSNLGNVKTLEIVVKQRNNSFQTKKERKRKRVLDRKGYYYVILYINRVGKKYRIHQLVAMAFLGHKPCGMKLVVDHINNIKTDNRLENLQIITNRENSCKDKKAGSSKYRGVNWNKNEKKWVSRIYINGSSNHLGYFKNEIEAHNAYQNKLKEIEE